MLALATLVAACGRPDPPPPPPLPAGCFAFGVFGDGPYRIWEVRRFNRVVADVDRAGLACLLHVGDIFWYPCSDGSYQAQLNRMKAIRCPVVYTPGDNEWSDCFDRIAGSHQPLERLAHLRATFFADPGRSLGANPISLRSQGEEPAFAEFVENARWVQGRFVFATIHIVGRESETVDFKGRSAADDEERARRTVAALAWMEEAFRVAREDSLSGVVLAMHADPGLARRPGPRAGYEAFVDRLEDLTREFARPVLLVHGDGHALAVDHPLHDRVTGEPLANFTRLETFGSPDIGWVRVVVDSVAGRIVEIEPRPMRHW